MLVALLWRYQRRDFWLFSHIMGLNVTLNVVLTAPKNLKIILNCAFKAWLIFRLATNLLSMLYLLLNFCHHLIPVGDFIAQLCRLQCHHLQLLLLTHTCIDLTSRSYNARCKVQGTKSLTLSQFLLYLVCTEDTLYFQINDSKFIQTFVNFLLAVLLKNVLKTKHTFTFTN